MKRLIALSVLGLFLTSCGGGTEKEDSDLLDGILNNPGGGGESEEVIDYEEPVSGGPSILPPEDETVEEALTEEDNE